MTELKQKLADNVNDILNILNFKEIPFTQVEKDIILQKLRELYTDVLRMQIEQDFQLSAEEKFAEEDDFIEFVEQKAEDQKAEEEKVEEVEKVVEKLEVIAEVEETIHYIAAEKEPTRTLNDLFIENQQKSSVYSQMQNVKGSDLTKLISINDKFLFIRELFNNKGEEFSSSVQKLNDCLTLEDAFEEIDRMKLEYYWDISSPAYLKLCDLIRRRY
ncbi:MAG: hypothetical protein LBU51_03565 [Bacteroidales bacterium]|nr:hypothetical protein [Bacteroidales bacterium]